MHRQVIDACLVMLLRAFENAYEQLWERSDQTGSLRVKAKRRTDRRVSSEASAEESEANLHKRLT